MAKINDKSKRHKGKKKGARRRQIIEVNGGGKRKRKECYGMIPRRCTITMSKFVCLMLKLR